LLAGAAAKAADHCMRWQRKEVQRSEYTLMHRAAALDQAVGLRAIDAADVRGNNHDAFKQYDLAIADYSVVIRLWPDFSYAYTNRALEECKKADCQAALSDYDKALKMNPDSTYERYGRGVARLRLGDKVGGTADILQAKSNDPDVEDLYHEIGFEPPR
jgi:tetratricopeptide (TPR) repeat protein